MTLSNVVAPRAVAVCAAAIASMIAQVAHMYIVASALYATGCRLIGGPKMARK
jgi:hypothetical protein